MGIEKLNWESGVANNGETERGIFGTDEFTAMHEKIDETIDSANSSNTHAQSEARALVEIGGTYRHVQNPLDFYTSGFYEDPGFYLDVEQIQSSELTTHDVIVSGSKQNSFEKLIGVLVKKQGGFNTSIRAVESSAQQAKERAELNTQNAASTDLSVAVEKETNETQTISAAFNFEYQAEILRWMGGSGVVGGRDYTISEYHAPGSRGFDASYSALNMHDHSNYRSMSGIAEQVVVVNGYYVRTRHLDYKYLKPIQGAAGVNVAEEVGLPEVPASVLAKPTGVDLTTGAVDKTSDTQARWMSRIFEDNPGECKVYLSCMQVWLERADGGVSDNVDSFRHEGIFDNAVDEFHEGTYLTHSGHKNRKENLNFQLNTVATVDEDGAPILARLAYSMTTQYMGNMESRTTNTALAPVISIGFNQHGHALSAQLTDAQAQDLVDGTIASVTLTSDDNSHHHDYVITWSGTEFVGDDQNAGHQHDVLIEENYNGRIPFNFAKAVAGTIDDENRYALVRDEQTISRRGGLPTSDNSRMWRFKCEDIERMCERVWGVDGEGSFIQESYTQYGLDDILQDRDSGELNAALYSRQYTLSNADASGRQAANRGFNDPNLFVASTENPNILSGKTWMIPIEIVVLTPLMTWNPYDLDMVEYPVYASGSGTAADPFSSRSEQLAYGGIPFDFWPDNGQADPADTESHMYILDRNNVSRHVWSQGLRVNLPSGERTRIPVYENYFESSYAHVQAKNRHDRLKSILKRMVQSQFYGTVSESEIDEL